MSRLIPEPKFYRHQHLMDELNELLMAVKIHCHLKEGDSEAMKAMKQRHPLPSVQELDKLQRDINAVLEKDTIGRKY